MGGAVVVADVDVNVVLPVDAVQGQVVTRLLQVVVQEWHHVMKALIRARHHERVCHAPSYATHHKRSDWCLLFSSTIRMLHFYTKRRLIYENSKQRHQPLESSLFFCFRRRRVRSFIQAAALSCCSFWSFCLLFIHVPTVHHPENILNYLHSMSN